MMSRWMYIIKAKNRPGALAAITAQFGHRGVSIDRVSTYEIPGTEQNFGLVVLIFKAEAVKKSHMSRLLSRLDAVTLMLEEPYEDEERCKGVLLNLMMNEQSVSMESNDKLRFHMLNCNNMDVTYLMIGSQEELDKKTLEFSQRGTLNSRIKLSF